MGKKEFIITTQKRRNVSAFNVVSGDLPVEENDESTTKSLNRAVTEVALRFNPKASGVMCLQQGRYEYDGRRFVQFSGIPFKKS